MSGLDPALTEKVRQQVCEALRIGATYEEAAQFVCVRYRVLRRVVKKGKRAEKKKPPDPEDAPVLSFYQDMEKARGAGAMSSLVKIAKGTDWRASAWKLLRMRSFYGEGKRRGKQKPERKKTVLKENT